MRFILSAIRLSVLAWPIPVQAFEPQPNIVLILADDFGYECVGANGGTSYKTPEIDKLAKTGIRFEHCYAQPLCTPSRVQLMTGIYNVRNYLQFGRLDRKQTTFAHLLKKHGYATCVAGKWQLGKEADSPQHFGFDESYLWQHTRGSTQHLDTRVKALEYLSRLTPPVPPEVETALAVARSDMDQNVSQAAQRAAEALHLKLDVPALLLEGLSSDKAAVRIGSMTGISNLQPPGAR